MALFMALYGHWVQVMSLPQSLFVYATVGTVMLLFLTLFQALPRSNSR